MELLLFGLIIATSSVFFTYHLFELWGAIYETCQDKEASVKETVVSLKEVAVASKDKAVSWLHYDEEWNLVQYANAA